MDGIRVCMVALLLCLAPIGGVVVASDEQPGQSMSVVAVDNTSEYLTPDSAAIDRTEQQQTGIDAAGTIEADAAHIQNTYRYDALRGEYRNAETDDERRAVIERGTEQFSQRVDALEAKQTDAMRQFNDNTTSERELLRTLSTVHHEAKATEEALLWLGTAADDLGLDDATQQATSERVRLVPMNGPARAQIGDAIRGESTSRIYVETAGEGLVLATVDPATDTYLREAHDPTAKREDVTDQYGGNPSPALDRFTELYPWSINSFDGIDAIGPADVRLYRFSASHPHGELETYLDSGSTEILYEKQWLDAGSVPTTTSERTEGDLRILLDTTRAGGPLGVSAVDTTTGERVDATVEINGDPAGSTDGGQLWTVAPRGMTAVNATHDGETVSVSTFID